MADENNPGFKEVSKDMADRGIPVPLYLCNKEQCDNCSYPQCKLTTNIFNKKQVDSKYLEEDVINSLANLSEEIIDLDNIDEDFRDAVAETMLNARNTLIYYVYFYDKERHGV